MSLLCSQQFAATLIAAFLGTPWDTHELDRQQPPHPSQTLRKQQPAPRGRDIATRRRSRADSPHCMHGTEQASLLPWLASPTSSLTWPCHPGQTCKYSNLCWGFVSPAGPACSQLPWRHARMSATHSYTPHTTIRYPGCATHGCAML